jgi:hypothetical protein
VTVRGGGGEKRNTGADGRVRFDILWISRNFDFTWGRIGRATAAGPTVRSFSPINARYMS